MDEQVHRVDLKDLVQDRILVLDGAMGTMIQTYHLEEDDFWNPELKEALENTAPAIQLKGNNDALNLTHPEIIGNIHRRYLQVGADLITTNTFSSQRVSQRDYHLEKFSYRMALEGARIARKCADEFSMPEHPRFVLGSVGPTNETCSMSPDVSNPAARNLYYDELFAAYSEEIDGLLSGGVDAILIETIFDTLNCKVAIDAAVTEMRKKGVQFPIMLSVTISDLAGRTLSGQTLDAFLASVSSYPIFSVGLNCSFGPAQMKPYLKELAQRSPYYITVYPNAGLPNAMGLYDETPDTMAPKIQEFVDEGLVNIIGGCCGTTPDFIARYIPIVKGKPPRRPMHRNPTLQLSGLELLDVTPEVKFVNIGERCNVAGSKKFLRLIKEKKYEEAVSVARKEVDDGALVIDVNMDDGLLDAKAEMVNFLNRIAAEPDIAKVPVMIDSSKWEVIIAGLKCLQGKGIVNSISLKNGEAEFIAHAYEVKRYGAACVVMCFDEQGQATTYERKIGIARRAYHILTDVVGMNPLDIIFDPNVLSIATGMEEHDAYAVDFLKATRWIRKNLPGAHVSGGISNLSFSFRGNNTIRESMHAVFLYYGLKCGLDFGIVNPSAKITYDDIPKEQLQIIEDVVLNRRKGAADQLIELADRLKDTADTKKTGGTKGMTDSPRQKEQWRTLPLEERLGYALRKGISDYLQEDLKEALEKYPHAVNIIEGPLMAGMNEVGKLFGSGKMFLPQVVKTARTMKQAVAILQPYIESERTGHSSKAGKVLLATVKGDVHDIGKNIVAVVMACNNYEVIDMGVMVPAEQIVKKAAEEKVDIIGLSGLITPSLDEMVNVARELRQAGLNIPIMIGGATTSQLHVALRIAPVYEGPVVWMRDASQNPIMASRLLNKEEKPQLEKDLKEKYEQLREHYQKEQERLLSLDEARKNKLDLFN